MLELQLQPLYLILDQRRDAPIFSLGLVQTSGVGHGQCSMSGEAGLVRDEGLQSPETYVNCITLVLHTSVWRQQPDLEKNDKNHILRYFVKLLVLFCVLYD